MFNGSNCDRKSQLSGILTEPLNPREEGHKQDRMYTIYIQDTRDVSRQGRMQDLSEGGNNPGAIEKLF